MLCSPSAIPALLVPSEIDQRVIKATSRQRRRGAAGGKRLDQLLVREQNCIQDPSCSGRGWPKHRPGLLHCWGEIKGLVGAMDQEIDIIGWLPESAQGLLQPSEEVKKHLWSWAAEDKLAASGVSKA